MRGQPPLAVGTVGEAALALYYTHTDKSDQSLFNHTCNMEIHTRRRLPERVLRAQPLQQNLGLRHVRLKLGVAARAHGRKLHQRLRNATLEWTRRRW